MSGRRRRRHWIAVVVGLILFAGRLRSLVAAHPDAWLVAVADALLVGAAAAGLLALPRPAWSRSMVWLVLFGGLVILLLIAILNLLVWRYSEESALAGTLVLTLLCAIPAYKAWKNELAL